ncbi:MAG: hypothetical protein WCX91_03170, partial [Candidatus Omnitrophota bacterium]
GILAGAGAWIMAYTVKNAVFIPNQLGVDKLLSDALNVMIEGDSQAKGLRFSRAITAIGATRVDFIDGNGKTVYFRLDSGTNKLYRSINGTAEQAVPVYSSTLGLSLSGKNGVLFSYYDANGVSTAAATNVRRINMILVAKTGSGLYNDWQGQSEQASSVAVKRLQ